MFERRTFETRIVTGRDDSGTTYAKSVRTFDDEDDAIAAALNAATTVDATVDVFRQNRANPATRVARVHPDGGIDFDDHAHHIEVADEYPACDKCGDPIDYCQGHGEIAGGLDV